MTDTIAPERTEADALRAANARLAAAEAERLIVAVTATDRAAILAGKTLWRWIDEADGKPLSHHRVDELVAVIRETVTASVRAQMEADE